MTTPTMHQEFPTWYSRVDLGDDDKRLSKRWAGVSRLVEDASCNDYEHLLDVFMAKPGVIDGAAGNLMRDAFTANDPTFPILDNEAEMTLLAEIILAVRLDRSEYDATAGYVANLIYSALHGGGVKVDSTTDLLRRAKYTMGYQGNKVRERTPLSDAPTTYIPSIKIDDCFDDDADLTDIETAKVILKKVVSKTTKAMGTLAKQARVEREVLEEELRIQGEELELLWWASNGQSETAEEQFYSMSNKGKPLIAACEAANLTRFCPGPASIAGLLEKVGLNVHEEVSLAAVVNDCDITWLRKIQQENVTTITPIHFAISLRLPSPSSTAWSDHWRNVTGIDPSAECSEVKIAELFYQERILLEAYGGA